MKSGAVSAAIIGFAAVSAFLPAWPAPAASPEPGLRSVWDGVYTVQQARRGEAAYARECAACHGATLKERDGAPPLAAPEFLAQWNGFSADDLFERIRRTMPTAEPGKLSAQEYADILALILGANQYPAGSTELDSRAERLKRIRLEAARPKP
jgi:S-disulfanyl-L-cysteine oxidoreductase SoxD